MARPYVEAEEAMIQPHSVTAIPLAALLTSMARPARGAPVRAASPPPAVRRPKAGVRQEKLRVLMMRGVSHATQKPVASPKPDVRRRNIQYWEQRASRKDCRAAAAVARRVTVRGWRWPWSHTNPATTRPTVLQIPALEMRKAASLGSTPWEDY